MTDETALQAEYVDVSVSNDTADALEEAGIEVDRHEDENGRSPSVNYLDYTEYIKGGDMVTDHIPLPGEDSPYVQEAEDQIPGVTKSQIRNRLELLLLPDELLNAVDNGTLTQSAARTLVRFRQLGDVEQMHEQMDSLIKEGLVSRQKRQTIDICPTF